VFDFGVARLDGNAISQRGDVIGTPGYMAPEQALAEDDVDARADVFALGCVLFECLTGTPAFRAAHPLAVLAEEPPRVGTLKPELAALDPLLDSVLAKDRDGRPSDARALHTELLELERRLFGVNPAP
jgi:serine/threonine protein kinase